jgi:TRAP-type C4-dicarboxylate transport system substrate-binding protein
MNRNKWNALPKEVQEVMDALGAQQAVWTGTYMDRHVDKSIDWSKKNYQVEFIELSESERKKWDRLLVPIVAKWIEGAEEKGLPGSTIVEDIRAFSRMYAGE